MSITYIQTAGMDWIKTLRKDPIPVLLEAAPLPIRYQVMVDILGDTESEDVEALQQNLRKHQPRRKYFAEQNEQGLWPILTPVDKLAPKQILTLQLLRQLEVLHELIELAATNKQEKALLGMREVIRLIAENEFSLRLHQLSQAIYLAFVLKLEGNPIIKQLVRELIGRQNSDGGWSSLPGEPASCIWTTQFFLWCMGHSQKFKKNRSLKKGLGYLRQHLLEPDQSKLLPGMQAWDTLISGTSGLSILTGGSLRYLEVEQLFHDGTRDRKITKRVDWLLDQQLKSGLWPSIVGRDRQGDHLVTLRTLRVLKHFQTLRLLETQHYDDDSDE